MSDIFISYSRKDLAIAAALARILPNQGWTLYWDRHLRAGEIFDDVIEREVTTARCVVVLWSSNSVGSQWVRNEADVGASRNALISVLIEGVTLPLAFRRVQAADLIGWKGDPHDPRLGELLQSIAYFLGGGPQNANVSSAAEGLNKAAGSVRPLTGAGQKSVFRPRTLERAEHDLAPFVGPIAGAFVERSAATCHDVAGLYQDLAQYVPANERKQFLRQCPEETTVHIRNVPGLEPAGFRGPESSETWRRDLEEDLAGHLGPIAGLVLDRALRESTSLEELVEILSPEILNESDRQAFLKRWRR